MSPSTTKWEHATGDGIPADLKAACPAGFMEVLGATVHGEPFWVFRPKDTLSWHVYGPHGIWTTTGATGLGSAGAWRRFLSPRIACLIVERGMAHRRSPRFPAP